MNTTTGEVISHTDPRRKELDKVDRKEPGRIKHFEDGGILPDDRFKTDSDGAVRFDDTTAMGQANVSEALNNPQQTFISSSQPTATPGNQAITTTMQAPSALSGVTPQTGALQADNTGSIAFSDNSAMGMANVRAAGIGSMSPSLPASSLPSFAAPPLGSPPSLAKATSLLAQPSILSTNQASRPQRIPAIGESLATDENGSIRFDDLSATGRRNTAFALTPLSQRKTRLV